MVTLIVLNIVLIIILVFLVLYIIGNKSDNTKSVCVSNGNEKEIVDYKQNKKINSDRVFEGRFITDEEYNQMIKLKRNDYKFSFEEVEREYEHLKNLNK
jgi:uncharacterized membrane protein